MSTTKKKDLKRGKKSAARRVALLRRIALQPNANGGDVAVLNFRDTTTILAALLYWREEVSPHGLAIMRPYFQHFHLTRIKPLTADEIEQLCARLRATIPKKH